MTGTRRKLVDMLLLAVPYHLDQRLEPFDLGVPADRKVTADWVGLHLKIGIDAMTDLGLKGEKIKHFRY